jgi:hypothetical protein
MANTLPAAVGCDLMAGHLAAPKVTARHCWPRYRSPPQGDEDRQYSNYRRMYDHVGVISSDEDSLQWEHMLGTQG